MRGWIQKNYKKLTAVFLAGLLLLMSITSNISEMVAYAMRQPPAWDGQTHNSGNFDSSYMCIDSVHILGKNGGIYAVGDTYKAYDPSEGLNSVQMSTIWWAVVSNYAASGNAAASAVINAARTSGIAVTNVSTEDVKGILHSPAVAGKYPWISQAIAQASTILTAAGLMGGSGSSTKGGSGKTVPSSISSNSSTANPLAIPAEGGSITLTSDFLSTVKIKYATSASGPFDTAPVNGWSHSISGDTITFTNSNGSGAGTYIMFDASGTAYASAGGSFTSPEQVYSETMLLWKCIACTQIHNAFPTPSPVEGHQRFVQIEFNATGGSGYYALLGNGGGSGGGGGSAETSMNFQVYVHPEDWTSHYNLKLGKYDYETGKGLEGSTFKVYERFDDKGMVEENDGPEYITRTDTNTEPGTGGITTSPQVWDNFREIGSIQTGTNGEATFTKTHEYHYEKTFCDGHPAPVFAEVPEPEEEEDEETGETTVTNQDEIDAAKEANIAVANDWITTVEECEQYASEHNGVHFHWIMSGVDEGEINSIAADGGSEGTTPDAGDTDSADVDTAFSESGCEADRDGTYDKYIALKYSYAFSEIQARDGYTQHDLHRDDIPIEIIRTDSSENGASSSFAGQYSSLKFSGGIFTTSYALAPASASPFTSFLANTWANVTTAAGEAVSVIQETIIQPVVELFMGTGNAEDHEEKESLEDGQIDTDGEVIDDIESTEEVETPLASPSETEKVSWIDMLRSLTVITAYAAEKEDETVIEDAADAEMSTDILSHTDAESGNEQQITEPENAHDTETASSSESTAKEAEGSVSELKAEGGLFSFSFLMPSSLLSAPLGAGGGGGESKFQPGSGAGEGHGYASPIEGGGAASLGPDGKYSHCNNADGEGNMWRVFDHRFEGQIHFNKRDLNLTLAVADPMDPYADNYAAENGDAALEGAVYGLYAAEPIIHPDGKTGVIYETNDLVSVATTDRNGDGSFMVYTESPGSHYNYTTGRIEAGTGGAVNLYKGGSYDDYTADGKYTRDYPDYVSENGNCWIGRPLIMGSYYIKELSRSEGYELSVEKKDETYTNLGENYNAGVPDLGNGYVKITEKPIIDGQLTRVMGNPDPSLNQEGDHPYGTPPIYASADYDEIFFEVTSKDTGASGYDLAFFNFAPGAKLYRLEKGKVLETKEINTGTYTEQLKLPITQIIATDDHTYIKGDGTGNPISSSHTTNMTVSNLAFKDNAGLDESKVTNALKRKEGSLDTTLKVTEALGEYYGSGIIISDAQQYELVKTKVEYALRLNGMSTPKDGDYPSEMGALAYSHGKAKTAEDPAEYGWAIHTLEIPGTLPVTVGDMITSILDWYNTHGYYTCGGIESITHSTGKYIVEVYGGFQSESAGCYSEIDSKDVIFMPIKHDSSIDTGNRIVYAVYTPNMVSPLSDGTTVYGYYTDTAYDAGKLSATLVNRAEAIAGGEDYTLTSYLLTEMEYYHTGEAVFDYYGDPVYETEWVADTTTITTEVEKNRWVDISKTLDAENPSILHTTSCYTDSFGYVHSDAGKEETTNFLIVLPTANVNELLVTLTAEDIDKMPAGSGWSAGNNMTVGAYYLNVNKASVKAYLDYASQAGGSTSSFVMPVTLANDDQEKILIDADTINNPISVQNRVIRQRIKIRKEIDTIQAPKTVWYCANCGYENADGTSTCAYCDRARSIEQTRTIYYANDTYNAVHDENLSVDGGVISKVKDWLSKLFAGGIANERASDISGFRFKAYLKSNIETLYRDEDGNVAWVDRNGNTIKPVYVDENGDGLNDTFKWDTADGVVDYPEKHIVSGTGLESANVQRIYTAVVHKTDSKTTSNRSNNVWNKYLSPGASGGSDVTVTEGGSYSTSERGTGNNGEAIRSNDSLYSYYGKNSDANDTPYLVDTHNTGYTRVLETLPMLEEDGSATRMVEGYNYEKFFDGIAAANRDKWDSDNASSMTDYPGQHWMKTYYIDYQKEDRDTLFRLFGFIRELVYGKDRSDYYQYPAVQTGTYKELNTSAIALANAQASDAVRSFATKYYLRDEAAKLMKDNGLGENIPVSGDIEYDESVYDQALNRAIAKAYDYLKPFFDYDLDTIYSVEWDTDSMGGADKDYTTLSADRKSAAEHYGVSAFLPYGTYIVVEQVPDRLDGAVTDLMNRSYKIDKPKEVMVPTVYATAMSDEYAHNYETHYTYDTTISNEEMSKVPESGGYAIRWGEEWSHMEGGTDRHVIRANSNNGKFEVYKYGLDVDHLSGSIKDSGGNDYAYHGFAIEQGETDPLKDYYNTSHYGKRIGGAAPAIGSAGGGNTLGKSAYPLEAYTGNTSKTHNGKLYDLEQLRNAYNYAGISEDIGTADKVRFYDAAKTDNNPEGLRFADGVKSMTGNLTSYEGVYAQMLVPWSITDPIDDYIYVKTDYTGYSDVPMDNSYYSAILKIYKTDSETGELILHDDAIFGIYAASRYTSWDEITADAAKLSGDEKTRFLSQFRPGDCRFYLEETEVQGSMEFLQGMKAYEIEPVLTGTGDFVYTQYNTDSPLCKGKVAKGTPICLESEQIKLKDAFGNRTGQMKVYTSKSDVISENPEGGRSYGLQNTGTVATPQPLGSGVYVLVELKPPAGYVRTKPLPYEIYYDKTQTYVFGDMYNKASLNREEFNLIADIPYD